MDVGAGCIPFCNHNSEILFLVHSMLKPSEPKGKCSKKEGFYVDCGGGAKGGESLKTTAIREFHEETMWVYADLLGYNSKEEAVEEGTKLLDNIEPIPYKEICWEYYCFFVPLPFVEIDKLNDSFENKRKEAGEKGRRFHWLTFSELETCLKMDVSLRSEERIRPMYTRYNKQKLLEAAAGIAKS
mmetsp:Transcript_125265/g.187087  ORF Transcript_125265/g.187087 Transcript_125265/m.187087 type:complete len:185 (-) Transcript_125265:37-591(-)